MDLNRRSVLLAVLTALLVLCVGVSAASAAVWKDKGTNVSSKIEITFTGSSLIEGLGGTIGCAVHATIVTSGGSTGTVTKYELTNCVTGGAFKSCKVNAANAKALPWTVDVNTLDLTWTTSSVHYLLNASCSTSEIELIVASTTVTLFAPSAITEIEFSKTSAVFSEVASLTVDSPNSGTYGIG